MKRAVWTQGGLDLEEDEPGPLASGWVRLRVESCGICGSDLHIWHGHSPRGLGTTPGHEIAGTVIEGPSGMPDACYAVSPNVTCGRCDHCYAGDPQLCRRGGYGIGFGRNGGIAEIIDAPGANLYPVDGSIDVVLASMAEPVAVAVRAIGFAALEPASRVLVLGAGSVGLLSALVARDVAAAVAVSARRPHQQELATSFGVTPLAEDDVDAWAGEHRPDVVIETVGGTADTVNVAIRAARRGGKVIVLGSFHHPVPVDLGQAMFKEVALLGSFAYGTNRRGAEFRTGVELLTRFRAELAAMQTHRFGLDEVDEAFRTASDKSTGSVKVTVVPAN